MSLSLFLRGKERGEAPWVKAARPLQRTAGEERREEGMWKSVTERRVLEKENGEHKE